MELGVSGVADHIRSDLGAGWAGVSASTLSPGRALEDSSGSCMHLACAKHDLGGGCDSWNEAGPVLWSPLPSLPHSFPLLFIPFLCLLGPATPYLCLSRRMPVCSVSGKRMSCPDSGNAQSIEISGHEGLDLWLSWEGGDSARWTLWTWVPCAMVGGGGAGILQGWARLLIMCLPCWPLGDPCPLGRSESPKGREPKRLGLPSSTPALGILRPQLLFLSAWTCLI